MSNIVNQIHLSAIQAAAVEKGSYSAALSWELNGGLPCDYKGDYEITLFESFIKKDTKTVTDTQGIHSASVTYTGLDPLKSYQITISVPQSQGGIASEKVKFIIGSFTDLKGIFHGEVFDLYWKTDTALYPSACCTMTCSNGVSNLYYPCAAAGYFRFSSIDFAPGDTIQITLSLILSSSVNMKNEPNSDESLSFGPVSSPLVFYASPISLLSAELSDRQEKNVSRLKLTLAWAYEKLEKVRVSFRAAAHETAVLSPCAVTKQEDGSWLVDQEIPYTVISFETLSQCTASCTALEGDAKKQEPLAESHVEGTGSFLPLAAPVIQIRELTSQCITVSAKQASADYLPMGYELYQENHTATLCTSRFTLPYNRDLSLYLRPRYDLDGVPRRGVKSNTLTSFLEGYYPAFVTVGKSSVNETLPCLQLYQSSFTETEVTCLFTEELFSPQLTESITAGSLTLEVSDAGYTLRIANGAVLSMTDYKTLIEAIRTDATPYGFYRICDAILRLASQLASDTCALLCAFDPKQRTADLRPGLILNLSTGVYQPQYDQKIPNTAGFSAMYSSSFPVSISKDGSFLTFDRYAGAIAEQFHLPASPNDATNIIYASGMMDLLQPAVRMPYYRLLYPSALTHSYPMELPYPSDNMVLLAADSYGALLTACDAIAANPAAINTLSIPVVIFKGRSALSLSLPVFFNGQRLSVPVGSTLQDVFQQQGIYHTEGFRLLRRSPDGRELPVFVQFAKDPLEIVLISGDKIVTT